ncbi:MAG: UDP-N-acetylmuramate dehydrogenase [Alphaproteobacteria bacterium]|nr:UDP-N-acetylmuramate dehydrogenase [Alphaproteobacteria bacterium]
MLKRFFNKIFKKSLVDILPEVKGKYIENAPLSRHTWFAVGGPAEVLFVPKDEEDLKFFLKNKPYNVPVTLIGGGSNLLVRDGGIPGVVIKLDSPYFRKHYVNQDRTITCFSGKRNVELKKVILECELAGIEFLCSIPGAIGGCIKTNAGCYGTEVKDIIQSAKIIDGMGNEKIIGVEDLKLSYRNSLFPDDWIIISITFKTKKDSRENIQKTLDEHRKHRTEKQPYNKKTAGSTFKNPAGVRAWELIKKSGADKFSVGGASVSDKHCNFLINNGTATAKDIETLGEKIIQQVEKETSITLEWEIKRVGVNK